MLIEIYHILPYAVLFSLPLALLGAVLLRRLQNGSLATALTVLAIVPVLSVVGAAFRFDRPAAEGAASGP